MSPLNQDRADLQRRVAVMLTENRQFREFLYHQYKSPQTDRLFTDSFNRTAPRIDCTLCAACCSGLEPEISPEEYAALKQRNPDARFTETHDQQGIGRFYLGAPCSFLDGQRCSIYGSRPAACSGYPHLDQSGTRYRLRTIFEQTKTCPIVFHVIEDLKIQTGFTSKT